MDLGWLPAQHASCGACTTGLICAKAPLCEQNAEEIGALYQSCYVHSISVSERSHWPCHSWHSGRLGFFPKPCASRPSRQTSRASGRATDRVTV